MSKCLVSEADYQLHRLAFTQRRVVVTGLRGPVIGAIQPAYEDAPTVCIYCSSNPVDPTLAPYCSKSCSISSERD